MTSRSIAVVGGGFGGVGAAVMLHRAGYDTVTVFERGDRVGGVWHHNTYPGAACDVPSHLYEFSFAPNPNWSRRYAPQPEIQAYAEDVARYYGVLDRIRTHTEVLSARWDPARSKWLIKTKDLRPSTSSGHIAGDSPSTSSGHIAGDSPSTGSGHITGDSPSTGHDLEDHEADVLITACGQLSMPKLPAIKGLDSFQGPAFHAAQWRHDVDLSGKRVAVIGTGCSAIQVVPAIQPIVDQLTVYQRSPAWTIPRLDFAYSARARRAFARSPALQRLDRAMVYRFHEFSTLALTSKAWIRPAFRAIGRHQISKAISDPQLRRKVTPVDEVGCKRVMPTDTWYPTLTQPNVALVDDPIAEVTNHGVRTQDGTERLADVLVLATGFKAHDLLAPMELTGAGGRTLAQVWNSKPRAYLGVSVPGFPNLFLLYGPNTGGGAGSVINTIEAAINHVISALNALEQRNARHIEIRQQAADAFDAELRAALADTVWHSGCTNWYVDENGHDPNQWPWTATSYRRRTVQIDPGAYQITSR